LVDQVEQNAAVDAVGYDRQQQRLAALEMLEQLRERPVEPYRDRQPVPRVIDVVGRRSGEPRPFGVNVTQIDGHLYICSATRERDWVRNLLAVGRCRIERDRPDGEHVECDPVMVEGREASRALATYLPQVGYRDPHLPFEPEAPLDEIERHVDKTAVFRLDPIATNRTA
jgi:deazaflavin-dependent oxidoreductase (nitroreductase family)